MRTLVWAEKVRWVFETLRKRKTYYTNVLEETSILPTWKKVLALFSWGMKVLCGIAVVPATWIDYPLRTLVAIALLFLFFELFYHLLLAPAVVTKRIKPAEANETQETEARKSVGGERR